MTGDFAFMFVCTIMVFLMTPGLAWLYGGMVRRKNSLNTMMFCLAMLGIGMLLWILAWYSLTFGEDHAGIIGDLNNILLNNVSWQVTEDGSMPEMVSAMFNMMFAGVSPAIILGCLAERMKFSKMMIFTVIWSLLVYISFSIYPLSSSLQERKPIKKQGQTVFYLQSRLPVCLHLRYVQCSRISM